MMKILEKNQLKIGEKITILIKTFDENKDVKDLVLMHGKVKKTEQKDGVMTFEYIDLNDKYRGIYNENIVKIDEKNRSISASNDDEFDDDFNNFNEAKVFFLSNALPGDSLNIMNDDKVSGSLNLVG